MKNTVSTLQEMLKSGITPMVQFTKTAEDIDWRWEEGMRGYVTKVEDIIGGYRITVVENEFSSLNKSLEKPVWFGLNDDMLPFSETIGGKKWTGSEVIIEDEEICNFIIVEKSASPFFDEYQQSKSEASYTTWLESELEKARKL